MSVLSPGALSALKSMPVSRCPSSWPCKSNLGVWTARKRKLEMSQLHWEWCRLRMNGKRLAVVAS